MKGSVFSPGKLLLTSEYLVLDGTLALAVPTQLGQEFFFEAQPGADPFIFWTANHQDVPWLYAKINFEKWIVVETNLPDAANFVLRVLQNIQKLSQHAFQNKTAYHFKTNLQFPPDYGLGSSSTLINNLAEWAAVDPFLLNDLSLGGSGYDIAVAQKRSAILFTRNEDSRTSKKINFKPAFSDQLIFVHLNQKQDSRKGINLYRKKTKPLQLITEFSVLTKEIVEAKTLQQFSELMQIHEQKLSAFLEIPTVKEARFPDYTGFIKSLGAWGGDFILASKQNGKPDYFSDKGYPTIYEWDKLIDS